MDSDQTVCPVNVKDVTRSELPLSPRDSSKSQALLSKKSQRSSDLTFEIREKKCDFCLENLISSEGQLIDCAECSGTAHKKCILKHTSNFNEQKVTNWLCARCLESKHKNRRFETYR